MCTKMSSAASAACLLAGTAIGSGMISLPMVLAQLGVVGTCLVMVAFAAFTYLTALIRADLNLNSFAEASLKDAGVAFGRPFVGALGDFMLKLLSVALMAAYLSGGASIVGTALGGTCSKLLVMGVFAGGIALAFLLASDTLVRMNKWLFVGMFSVLLALIVFLFMQTPLRVVPRASSPGALRQWSTLVPILFTSFGFQGSIHSMTKVCQNDRALVHKACLWGSAIPAVVYSVWTTAILLVTANTAPAFFQKMLQGQATDVGELVSVLSQATSSACLHGFVWVVSGLALLTSIIGVGLALLDIIQQEWRLPKGLSVAGVVGIPALIAVLIPNAFIRILNVSGMILAVIAILVPCTLSLTMQRSKTPLPCRPLLSNRCVIGAVFLCGVGMILLGGYDALCH